MLSLLTSFNILIHFASFASFWAFSAADFEFQSCTSLVQLILYNSFWNQPRNFLNIDVKFQVSKAQDLNAIHHPTFASSTSHYLTKSLHKPFRHGGFGTLKSRLKGWRGIKDGCENCFTGGDLGRKHTQKSFPRLLSRLDHVRRPRLSRFNDHPSQKKMRSFRGVEDLNIPQHQNGVFSTRNRTNQLMHSLTRRPHFWNFNDSFMGWRNIGHLEIIQCNF